MIVYADGIGEDMIFYRAPLGSLQTGVYHCFKVLTEICVFGLTSVCMGDMDDQRFFIWVHLLLLTPLVYASTE